MSQSLSNNFLAGSSLNAASLRSCKDRLLLLGIFTMLVSGLYSQTAIGGLNPNQSAMLDVQSTDRGVLFPRLTTAQRNTISNPANGLMIFNLTTNSLQINIGSPLNPSWASINPPVVCRAKISATEYKTFMCHNLGAANPEANPFNPSWEINGNYYQWGRKPTCFGKDDVDATNTCTGPVYGAAGPWGDNDLSDNAGAINNWNTVHAGITDWDDATKTTNDPCPTGFRVPTDAQWQGIIMNNTMVLVGSFNNISTNYDSGLLIGTELFLPAAGFRSSIGGALSLRASGGYYYSSTQFGPQDAYSFAFESPDNFVTGTDTSLQGMSVRCISE